jgi:transcriptional regulator with XRE-family HTH domain
VNLNEPGLVFPSDEWCMEGRRLRELRVHAGLSARDLAARLGVYRKQVQRWEKAHRFCLPRQEMMRLLEVLIACAQVGTSLSPPPRKVDG